MSSKAAQRSGDVEKLSFEQILERLEKVVQELEKGELSLEESLAMFEEGVRLSRVGGKRLDSAEQRVELLLEKQGELTVQPLETDVGRESA